MNRLLTFNSERYAAHFQEVLGDGLLVSGLPLQGAHSVQLTLTFAAGAYQERSGQEGSRFLLATLLGRGCGAWDRRQFAVECDRRGASLEFFAGRDTFTIEISILPDDLDWAVQVLGTLLFEPRLEQREVEVAIEEQLEMLEARRDEPRLLVADTLRKSLFGENHAYGRSTLGMGATVAALTLHELRVLLGEVVGKEVPCALVVVGQFEPEGLLRALKRDLRDLGVGRRRPPSRWVECASAEGHSQKVSVLDFEVDQAWVAVGFPAFGRTHPKHLETLLANELFGGSFLSRVTRTLRGRDGLAYSADSRLWSGFRGGFLWLSLQTDRFRVGQALESLRVVVDSLLEEGPTKRELEHFKEFFLASLPYDYDSFEDLSVRLLESLFFAEDWRPEIRSEKLSDAFTRENVESVFHHLLQVDHAKVCLLGEGLSRDLAQNFFLESTTSLPIPSLQVPSCETGQIAEAGLSSSVTLLESWTLSQGVCASLLRFGNGYHLLHLPRPEFPAISLQIWSLIGSMDEPKGRSGMSHLLEHLMFRGTYRYPDGQFDQVLASKGGLNNAFTTEDFTVYTDYIVPQALKETLKLEVDRFTELVIRPDLFELERAVVLEERSLRVDCHPLGKLYEWLQERALVEHPYRHPVIGRRQELMSLQPTDLNEHYDKSTDASRVLIVLAGGCDQDEAVAAVAETFGSVSPGRTSGGSVESSFPCLCSEASELQPVASIRGKLQERSGYSYILLAFRAPRIGHPDYPAVELLSRILAGGESSRLYERLVRQSRKALEVWVNYEGECREHPLLILGASFREPIHARDLEREIWAELASVKVTLSSDELSRASRGWLADEAFAADQLEDWATEVATRVLLLPWHDVWRVREQLEQVTVEQIQAVAERYLRGDMTSVAVLEALKSSD